MYPYQTATLNPTSQMWVYRVLRYLPHPAILTPLMTDQKKILVLGLGNDILADDAVGILAVRELAAKFPDRADFVDTAEHGVVLLDYFIGYEKAIVVDAIVTGKNPPGTILEIDPADLRTTPAPSPHFTGLPELFRIAEELGIEFPRVVKIIAMEVEDPFTIGGEITPAVKAALPEFVHSVEKLLMKLLQEK